MAKSGKRNGVGMLASDDITAEQVIQNMKEQASAVKQGGFIASLKLQTDSPKGRLWIWTEIDGVRVKRFVDGMDANRYDPNLRNEDGSAVEKAYQKSSNRDNKRKNNRRK
jgi:hypothetical protein